MVFFDLTSFCRLGLKSLKKLLFQIFFVENYIESILIWHFWTKITLILIFVSRFNNAQHSRATTPKNTSTLVNTLDLVSMGSGSRKTRNKTPTSMAKTPTSNIVGSGTLSSP